RARSWPSSPAAMSILRSSSNSLVPDSTAPAPDLRRVIGVRGLAAAIFNITVGAAIFVLPAHMAGSLGAAAPLAYLVCAVATGLGALCFADAGGPVPREGGTVG